ncbi:MAG: hypothetical protein ABIZ50_01220 [Solirubrobacterales bacterium]
MTLACAFTLISVPGCGDDSSPTVGDATAPADSTTIPEADTADADPADLKVIEEWSSALSDGDVRGAAAYFATPSTAENGAVIAIESPADAIAFNASLPCGAEVIAANTQGDFTSATFRLSDRPGGGCGPGAGSEASTSFQIEGGKIVEWRRIDMPQGGPKRSGGGAGAPI